MKKLFEIKKLISILVMIIMVITLISTGLVKPFVSAVTTTYQSSTSFNNGLGIQGKDQWYYQQWNGSSYSNLTWVNASQNWYGTQTYLAVGSSIMHPEASLDAVRKWVAPCDGSVRIYGNVKKADTGGGDGVIVTIKQNSTTIWGQYSIAYNDSTGLNFDSTRSVKAGDAIYFLVSKNGTIYNDSTIWDPYVDLTPLAVGTNVIDNSFTSSNDGWTANWHCTASVNSGYLNVSVTASDASIVSSDNLNLDVTKTSILKIRYKNSTNNTSAQIYFITNDDITYNQAKCKVFTVNANDANYTEYTIDMSGVYGWVGKLKRIRFDPSDAASGSYNIDYIKLQTGGSKTPGFSLLDKEVIYDNNTLKNVLDLDYYADSGFGIRRNSDASYDFYTANGGSPIGQHSTITHGTLEKPAATITYKWKTISGIPAGIDYTGTNTVYQDPTDANTLISFLHLERQYVVNSVPYFDASIGLAITRNNGSTWTFCGEIIDHDIAPDESRASGYDIGGGAYIIYNSGGTDYFYVYAMDNSEATPYKNGLSVSRASVASVLAAAKNNTSVSWYKYYNSAWTQPAMNGSFTDLFDTNRHMNWMSVSYNTYLSKYLLTYASTDQWGTNYSDISLLISNSPTDFINNTLEYLIDSSTKYHQYPTIFGLGNSNPQIESQKNFYIYYMQWADGTIWNSDTNLVRKMIVLD